MENYYKHLGESIRQIRCIRGMSQESLARKLGVGKTTVSKWERGIVKPTPLDMDKMACALRCTTDVFYHLQRQNNSPDARQRAIRAIDSMTEKQREIMWFLFSKWDGDKEAFFELSSLYMAMPKSARAEIALHFLQLYSEIKSSGTLSDGLPDHDIKLIEKRWKNYLSKE